MKDVEKLEKIVEPYYDQFEKLGDLWEDEMLSWGFLKRARKRFGKRYFYEVKLFTKAENRKLRHEFRVAKRKDKKLFKRVWRRIRAQERAKRKTERAERKRARSRASRKSGGKRRNCKKR